ncbi:hypothetical protein [Chloroflexus aggregans]|uniref:Uncharacterized protein n=1 Tax=Chloroflexus aggregans (strain MD-66 / DSM 9485) TaxID=326427 RepID=B8G4Y5_CHLAD|nr:hypothetical protein [Chloroflexus aggregans]ACL23618.1 hypothetical protein Cagg_0687 [Chloroflexus aggregans DSM 9485]
MNQSQPFYDVQSAVHALDPWREQHLPNREPGARPHFIQLVAGMTEQHAFLFRERAASSAGPAEQPESTYPQVQRIIRDTRLPLETVSSPCVRQLLASIPSDVFSVTLDATNQGKRFTLVVVGWATDGIRLPLGFLRSSGDGRWAEEARRVLDRLEGRIPPDQRIVLLADRVHPARPCWPA